jgi:hypothetical protein
MVLENVSFSHLILFEIRLIMSLDFFLVYMDFIISAGYTWCRIPSLKKKGWVRVQTNLASFQGGFIIH